MNFNNDKSKKRRLTTINKVELWKIFDDEITNKSEQLECLFGSSGNRELCDHCQCSLAFSEEGFLVCTNNKCGIIYKDIVDQSAEWRYYGADDKQSSDPTRCGMPINPLLEASSYGCTILMNGHMTYEMRKIRRYAQWQSMPYKEKSQYDEFQIITTMAQNAGIPKMIIDDAIRYHKRISEFDVTFRGDNRDGILAASIYISCRINNLPRTAKEIAQIFHLDVTIATKGCKNAVTIINNLEKDMDITEKTNFCKTTPESFIDRYCSKLNINKELIQLCHFISIKIEKNNLMPENTPPSIAAGIVYFVSQICKLNITKTAVKNVSETSEVTINKCFKKLETINETSLPLIPRQITLKYGC
jgi:transcription initiation factor TFIIB